MRLDEITQKELQVLSRRSQKWADKVVNLKPKKTRNRQWYQPEYQYVSTDLSEILGPYLERKGLKQLGEGAFAVVYGRPRANRVVKISMTQDRCWLEYANWAMGQQHKNPHVPDIHHLESYALEQQNGREIPVFFAVMERLLPFEEKNINFKDKSNIALLAYLTQHEGFGHLSKMRYGVGWKKNPFQTPNDFWDPDPKYVNKVEKLAKKGKTHDVIKLFKQVENKWAGCNGDFHDGNIMIRPGTGEFVITDPLASGGGW